MRVVCLSDTHGLHDCLKVPDGDLLLHAGDFSMACRPDEIERFDRWLGSLPHPHKVVVAGNHDFLFERAPERARALITNACYLEDCETRIDGLRIWGSPWQPWFYDWAFNLQRGPALASKWDLIPDEIDVLVTHGPPAAILDRSVGGEDVGCRDLTEALRRVRPRLHLFGHIHEAYGTLRANGTLAINACNCDLRYRAANRPVVVDWVDGEPRLVP